MDTSRLNEVKPSQGTRRSRVQVRAVHVDLAAALVRDSRQISDSFFKHPIGGRVRDHDRRQVVLVFFRLGLEVVQINIAVVVGLDLRASIRDVMLSMRLVSISR